MNKEYYARYAIHERSHWWFLAREEILKSLLSQYMSPATKDLKILNIGAATGRTTEWLSNFGEVTTLEYDKECCEYLIQERGIEALNGSITELPIDNAQYDIVCAYDVIEHVEDDHLAMIEVMRVLKPNGYAHISVPALMTLWSKHVEINHHYRRYDLKGLKTLMNTIPGDIIKMTYFNTILFPMIYFVRKVSQDSNTESENISDFDKYKTFKAVNSILKNIFQLEKYILKLMTLPIGVSLVSVIQKK